MSVSAISSSNLFSLQSTPPSQPNSFQKAQAEFQQLGSDLQSGNLSAAQSDFSTLQSLIPQSGYASSILQGNTPIANAFKQLGKDLQSGNLSGAQTDYASIRQDFQKLPHQHHHGGPTPVSTPVNQLFEQLGSALQSGDLSTAQQAYSSLTEQLGSLSIPGNAQVTPGSAVSISV